MRFIEQNIIKLQAILKKVINKSKKLVNIIKYIEDILIFSGLIIIIWTTFIISKIAGRYCLGITLVLLGIYFAKNPPERG